MTSIEYEQLVLGAARRRREGHDAALHLVSNSHAESSDTAQFLDRLASGLEHQIAQSALSDEELAIRKASLFRAIESGASGTCATEIGAIEPGAMQTGASEHWSIDGRRRTRWIHWTAGCAAAATILFATIAYMQPTIVGQATVITTQGLSSDQSYSVRAGKPVVADAGTSVQINLEGGAAIELQSGSMATFDSKQIAVVHGSASGQSGAEPMQVVFGEWSLYLESGTLFTVRTSAERIMLWTDREASLRGPTGERLLAANERLTLDSRATEQR